VNAGALRPAWPLPHTRAPQAASPEPLLKAAIVLMLLSLTVFDRFGLGLLAQWSLPPSLFALYLLAAVMVASGAARLNPQGAVGFAAVVAVSGFSYLVNTWADPRAYQSVTSWMLVALSYAPFAIALAPGSQAGIRDADLWRWTMRAFVAFALLVALAGIAQFLAQFVFRPAWLFDYTAFIPERLRNGSGWHTVHPVSAWVQADGYWMKSNGFFMREPSMFSLAMALGIVCELALGARRWVLGVLAAALVLSYSGSGVLCLVVAMAFPLGVKTVVRLAALAAAAALLMLLLGDALNLSYTLGRVAEFGSETSSAYCRFVHPWISVARFADTDVWSALLGHGPGSMTRIGASCADLHEPTYGKLLFEYGLVGALAFGALVIHALNRASAPIRVRVALGFAWLFLGGNLVNSELLPMIFLLSAMWPRGAAAGEAPANAARGAPGG
jgi:hypothetical protein